MSTRPAPPITVYDNGDLEVYADVETTCRGLEVYDLGDLWIADRLGRPLRAVTTGYGVADLVIADEAEPVPSLLADRLRAFVGRIGPGRVGLPDDGEVSLDQLLAALLRFFEMSRESPRETGRWLKRFWRRHGR